MSFSEMLFAAPRVNLDHLPELPGVFTLNSGMEAENAQDTLNVLSESASVDFMFSDEFYNYPGVARGGQRTFRGAAETAR